MGICFNSIGQIRSPYIESAPYQPVDDDYNQFKIVLSPEYTDGITGLDKFEYIYVLYFIDRIVGGVENEVIPPWTKDHKVGVFASRSPVRPNAIGLSVVKIKNIRKNTIQISGIDVFDNTPLLDIKPYLKGLDSKADSNRGWVDEVEGSKEHLDLHIKGIPHDH